MVLPSMVPVPVAMPTLQLIEQAGQTPVMPRLIPAISWSSGPRQSDLPRGPCHACGQLVTFS